MRRDYPPGVILHAPHCIEGGNSPAAEINVVYREYPSHQLHFCFGGMVPPGLLDMMALREIMPFVVVEQVEYGRHDYERSDVFPDDATQPLCRRCRGTHGDTTFQGTGSVRSAPTTHRDRTGMSAEASHFRDEDDLRAQAEVERRFPGWQVYRALFKRTVRPDIEVPKDHYWAAHFEFRRACVVGRTLEILADRLATVDQKRIDAVEGAGGDSDD